MRTMWSPLPWLVRAIAVMDPPAHHAGLQNNTLLAPPTLLAPRSSLQLAPLLAPTTASVFWCCLCTTLATSRWTC